MTRVISTILLVFWGLWFGGNIALFIFVSALFRHDRALAVDAAPVLFVSFERYHLILAAASAILAGAWLTRERGRATTVLFVLLLVAGTAAAVSGAVITPKIMQLRREHRIESADFKRTHGISMMVYSAEALTLLAAGVALSGGIHRQRGEGISAKRPSEVSA